MALLHYSGTTIEERRATRAAAEKIAAELRAKMPPAPPRQPKKQLVSDLPKNASRLCQELVLGLEVRGIDYSYVHPSQLHISYNERKFVLDARTKENKWYAVNPNGISKGYHLSSLERFLQSVDRFDSEFRVA